MTANAQQAGGEAKTAPPDGDRGGAAPRRHRLGFAVKVLGDGGMPSHDSRRWQSGPHLSVSLEYLQAVLDYLHRNDIRMYRMATALAPYASHPEMPQFHNQVAECAAELEAIGAIARRHDIRLSIHPGQYTVINSQSEGVRDAALAELEVQAAILDSMGVPAESVVVIHVGSAAGGTEEGADRFLAGVEMLSERARSRLVVENDDRSFGLADVLAISRRSGIPIVWDVLHHRCHDPDGIPDLEALSLAASTWADGVVPKIHYSSPRLDVQERKTRRGRRVERRLVLPQLRAHADLVDPIGFEHFLRDVAGGPNFDVMLEAKAKDLALLRLRAQLAGRGFATERGRLIVPKRT